MKWLADSIPGNLFEKSPDFAAGTEEAAMQNFILIFSNVYSKFATFEQLMKRFNQPVNESDSRECLMCSRSSFRRLQVCGTS